MRAPNFDELIGPLGEQEDDQLDEAERERLRRVHDLLLQAGPPPELSPEIEAGPTFAMMLQHPPRRARRGVMLVAAAVAILALAFLAGYITGNGSGNGPPAGRTLSLVGTKAAPGALASLRIEPVDPAGNWPMLISVTGLPKLPPHGYYTVYLMRNGKPLAPCGTFVVTGKGQAASVWLNAPYELHKGDSWVVTEQMPGHHDAGPIVLRPRV
jgi:hypothetical protein